jgi:murein DD-endopeptidase MepM/ murein hydrolase activator NlpD
MFHWVFAADVAVGGGWTEPGQPHLQQRTRRFRSWRGGGRWHAACDLAVPLGTPIRAVCDGTVLARSSFYEGTWQVTVLHRHEGMAPFIVRYGEVLAPADGGEIAAAQADVAGGSVIARVGQLDGRGQMLHFELYAGSDLARSLSIAERYRSDPDTYTDELREQIADHGWDPDFQRRNDLADPTAFLLALRDGRLPPPPSPYRRASATPPLERIDFGEDEVGVIHGRVHQPHRPMPSHHLPSWLESHLQIEDADPDRAGHP